MAKLRALKKDDSRLLLKTEMKAGHGGPTARDDGYREIAVRWAFLLDLSGGMKIRKTWPDLRELETRFRVGKVAYNLDLREVRLKDQHVIRRINVFLSVA